MNMQLKSSSSYYYSRYRKPRLQMREMYEGDLDYMYGTKSVPEEAIECILTELRNIPEDYQKAILSIIYDKTAEREILKNFPAGTITFRNEIDRHLLYIKTKCQHCI